VLSLFLAYTSAQTRAEGDEKVKPDIVGRRLKKLRRARGLGQRELAELADVQQGFISQIETGKRRGDTIQLNSARRMAYVLGVTLDELAGVAAKGVETEEDNETDANERGETVGSAA
jgi:transcriptional regulator with XRE-family HTH domain